MSFKKDKNLNLFQRQQELHFYFFTTKNVILQKVSRLIRMRKKSVGNNSMFNKKKVIEVKEL